MKGLVATGCLIASASAAAVLTARDATTCPGYQATNVKKSHGSIVSADLTLAGDACNVYGTDLNNLVLQVDYETGKKSQPRINVSSELTPSRDTPSCQDLRRSRAGLPGARLCSTTTRKLKLQPRTFRPEGYHCKQPLLVPGNPQVQWRSAF